ncbi:MAG: L,D-transpeptidase family protein [Alphaproteobacteria bacterium]
MQRRNIRSNVRERISPVLRPRPGNRQRGAILFGSLTFPCALGPAGPVLRKREGDGATPAGRWKMQSILYRADRISRPITSLPVRAMRPSDGWCDAPEDRNYNRLVVMPYETSAENMWRDDHIYDLVVVLDHNTAPRIRGFGSAIFIHLARDGYKPTQGCIALKIHDLRMLLEASAPGSVLTIMA